MRFARFEALVGEKTAALIAEKCVFVAGLGGVGSYAVEALARSGIGTLILVDGDVIDVTNINRQLYALDSTVGHLKVEVAAARLHEINPLLRVIAYPRFLDGENLFSMLNHPIDFIIDAIDSVDAKTFLIKTALDKGIPLISSMGFAKKLHPEAIKLGMLSETTVCPLAKTMRIRLKAEGMSLQVPVVYSTETPLESQTTSIKLGSVSTVPSVAGLLMASYVLNRLIDTSKEAHL